MYGFWSTEIVGEFDPEEWFGMVYLICNRVNGRKYVGKKQFRSRRRKKITGRKNRKVHVSESNWREYTGSCEELNKDILSLGQDRFKFVILRLCPTKRDWSYGEIEEQVTRKVLTSLLEDGTREYYNGNIMSRWFCSGDKKTRDKISEAHMGMKKPWTSEMNKRSAGQHWYNNGEIQVRSFTKPLGFTTGRLKSTVAKISRSNTGQKRSYETRLKIGQTSKGRIPWNKGLRKETDLRVFGIGRKISKTMRRK